MATRLVMEQGRSTGKDRITQSNKAAYIGDPSSATGTATTLALTGAYKDKNDFDSGDSVVDAYDVDTIMLLVDYTQSAGTDCRIKVEFGEDDDRTLLNTQESREDNGTSGKVIHELVEHTLSASYRGLIEVPRLSRYFKVSAKSSGSPDAGDLIAIAYFGQVRQ